MRDSVIATLEEYLTGIRVDHFEGDEDHLIQGEGTYDGDKEIGEEKWEFQAREGGAQLYRWHEEDAGGRKTRLYAETPRGVPNALSDNALIELFFKLWEGLQTRDKFGTTREERLFETYQNAIKEVRDNPQV